LGELNEWHFGHEASQERPDCQVGTLNLLRRLAIGYLRDLPLLQLPKWSIKLTTPARFGQLTEGAEWISQPVSVIRWDINAAKGEAVAMLLLANSAEVDLHVEVAPRHLCSNAPSIAERLFLTPQCLLLPHCGVSRKGRQNS
jgi:hypothetical protein